MEISRANASTTQSIRTSLSRGTFDGTKRRMKPNVPTAVTIPATPPTSDSSIDSVSIWRTMRPRLAPSAERTAISCCRPEARAKRRLANVQRYDENDQDYRTQQHQQHGPNLAHQSFLQWLNLNCPLRLRRVIGGKVVAQFGSHGSEPRLCLRQCQARLKSSNSRY